MTETTETKTAELKPNRKRNLIVTVVIAVVALVIGGVIGAAINSHSSEVASLHSQVASLTTRLAVAKDDLTTANSKASAAQTTANNAVAAAQAKAKAEYAGKMAKADALLRQLQKEQGIVQASTISADGVYVVGKDIPSGTYHTTGGNQCYYATLGSTDTSNILDNNNFNGPETVDVSGAYAFQIQGGCTWVKA